MNPIKIEKKTIFRIFLCVLGCIAFYWLLHETDRVRAAWKVVSDIIAPFVVGGVLAFIFNVPMRAFENMLKGIKGEKPRRILAIILTLLVVCVVIAGVVTMLVPQINDTIELLLKQLPGFFERLEENIMRFLEERPELMEWVSDVVDLESFDVSSMIQKGLEAVGDSLAVILTGALSAVTGVFNTVFNLVISIVFAFYCLGCKETLARQGRKVIYAVSKERFADQVVRVLRMTNSAFSNFLTGQCLEAVILGLLFVPAMAIFRMPYIPLICVLIAVTALVPLVGAFTGCILGAFFILVNDPMQAVVFVIMFLAIQQFEGNVIYPRVVGGSIGLPGMWVLLAVAIGGGLFGVVGMFLMVPFASVIYALCREYTQKNLEEKGIDPDKLHSHPPVLQSHFKIKAQNAKKKRIERREERVERREERKSKKSEKNQKVVQRGEE